MKPIIFILLLTICSQVQAQQPEWKEYKAFYDLVQPVLHPAEYGDLKPVKDSAELLMSRAKAWMESAIPAVYPATAIKKSLAELYRLCGDLVNGIRDHKTDEEIGILAIKVHNKFHYISGRQMR